MLALNENPLLRWRREHNYTQQDVASLAGVTDQTVRRIEHGTLAMAPEISHLMGGSADYVYEKWRSDERTLVKKAIAEAVEGAIAYVDYYHAEDTLVEKLLVFGGRALGAQDRMSVNALAKMLRVDPRRITELRDRDMSTELRRALLQIGLPASTLYDWEHND